MKNFILKAPLMLLLANLALTWHPEGSHSLGFLKILLTEPNYLEHQFTCDVYLDDILVERFSSRAEIPRLELCAPWVGQPKPDYWEKETQIILIFMDVLKELLKEVILFLNHSEIGNFHNGLFTLSFNDGEDFLCLTETMISFLVYGKAAMILKQVLEESGFPETMRTFLKGECVHLLLAHLDYGKEIFLKTDTPKVHVTRKVRDDGNITLKCWAMNFYPKEITLIWQRDEVNQDLHTEVIETRPAGDGTFQKWAAVVVPSGEEQRYTCHVNHEGLPEPITVKWEPPQSSVPIMPIVTGMVLGAVLMGAVVTFLIWKRRTKE